mmetsp:Transcript_2979/g.4921  ORF Transcript_2979/g.4921 Transcript_2979/m.4921 type:complete len:136 (-) Transcript_2979:69-476(-)
MVKAFLKYPGGVDEYPSVSIVWKLHHRPELRAIDERGTQRNVDLTNMNTEQLHAFFSAHFERRALSQDWWSRQWRRWFGWIYGLQSAEAATFLLLLTVVVLPITLWCLRCVYDSLQSLDATEDRSYLRGNSGDFV